MGQCGHAGQNGRLPVLTILKIAKNFLWPIVAINNNANRHENCANAAFLEFEILIVIVFFLLLIKKNEKKCQAFFCRKNIMQLLYNETVR